MSSEKGSSKADTLVKVVLVFFISLLSFSVGTFVGKQVSDSDHRRMALEGEYKTDRQVASTDAKAEGDTAEKISDKEVENLTEEFVNKEKAAATETADTKSAAGDNASEGSDEKPEPSGYKSYDRAKMADNKADAAAPKAEPALPEKASKAKKVDMKGKKAKAADSKTVDATEKVADKVAMGDAPTDGAVDERKPASSPLPSVASSAIGKYTVQVASYADEKEAKTHAADLKGKGWNAFYFPAAVQGRTWFRVSVGLFTNFKSATEFRAQFMKDANTKSAIVQKIIQ